MIHRTIQYLKGRRSGLSEAEIAQVAAAVVRDANIHGIDPNLVMAVIHIESRGNAYALSPVGAMGLMQIMPPTGEELAAKLDIPWRGSQTLFDPLLNVRLGIAYLEQLESRYGSMPTALAAYNWGPGRIDSRIRHGVALPVVYSGSVLATYRAPRSRSGAPGIRLFVNSDAKRSIASIAASSLLKNPLTRIEKTSGWPSADTA